MNEVPRVLDRWELLAFLGEGTLGSVYLVADELRGGRRFALKLVQPERLAGVDPEEVDRTFEQLLELRHPHLVETTEIARIPDLGAIAVAMTWLPGDTLFACAAGDRFDPLARWGAQACAGLAFLHRRGILHGNLKPENVRVAEPEAADGTEGDPGAARAFLLDPALAPWMLPPRTGRRTRGSFAYAAPELLLNHPGTVESDLYSIGVLLFEAAARRLPYAGDDALSLMRQHLAAPVPDPRQVNPRIPAPLARVLGKLLAKEPTERFSDAQEAADALAKAASPARTETKRVQRVFVPWGRLVGRDAALAEYRRHLDAWCDRGAWQKRAPLLLFCGASGLGKTRLQRECRSQAQVVGAPYLVVRCPEIGCAPFEPIADLVEQLATLMEDLVDVPTRARLQTEHADVLDRFAPAPKPTAGDSRPDSPPPEIDWGARVAALTLDVARAVALAVTFDDLDRADAGTRSVVGHLADELAEPADPEAKPARLVLAGAARPASAGPWAAWETRMRLRGRATVCPLPPLAPGDVASLARSMAGAGGEETAGRLDLATRSAGDPLVVEEALRESFEGDSGEDPPRTLAGIVAGRWRRTSEPSREVLAWLAAYGRPVASARLAFLAGTTLEAAQAALDEGERMRLLGRERHSTHGSWYRFPHERVRGEVHEVLLSATERQAMHRHLGALLAAEAGEAGPARWAEALVHLEQGGDDSATEEARRRAAAEARGVDGACAAGEASLQRATLLAARGRVDDAFDRLGEADAHLRRTGETGRDRVALLRAGLLLEHGHAEAARRHAEVAVRRTRRADDRHGSTLALVVLGESLATAGELATARECLEEALYQAAGAGAEAGLDARAAWGRLHALAGDRETARAEADELLARSSHARDAWAAHDLRARAALAGEGPDVAVAHLERAVHAAAVLGRPTRLVASLSALAFARAAAGLSDRSVAEAVGRVEAVQQELGLDLPELLWLDLALARLHRRHGRKEEEAEAVDRGVERLRGRPLPHLQWRAYAERARWAAGAGRTGECTREARRAFAALHSVWTRLPDAWRTTFLADPEKQRFRAEMAETLRGSI